MLATKEKMRKCRIPELSPVTHVDELNGASPNFKRAMSQGRRLPLELQLLHKATDTEETLIVSIPFEAGPPPTPPPVAARAPKPLAMPTVAAETKANRQP